MASLPYQFSLLFFLIPFPSGFPIHLECPDASADGVQLEFQGAVASLNPLLEDIFFPTSVYLASLTLKVYLLSRLSLQDTGIMPGLFPPPPPPCLGPTIVPKAVCYLSATFKRDSLPSHLLSMQYCLPLFNSRVK